MGKKEQAPALAIFVQGSLWVWSATSRGRPPGGGLALAVLRSALTLPVWEFLANQTLGLH